MTKNINEVKRSMADCNPGFPNGLFGGKRTLELVFPDSESRPCLKSLERYAIKKLVPSVKLGRRRFYHPDSVAKAIGIAGGLS